MRGAWLRSDDINGDGNLDANEIMYMLLSTQETTDPTAAMVISVMSQLDGTGDGCISKDEFVNRGVRNPLITRALDRWFQVKRTLTTHPVGVFQTADGESIAHVLQGILNNNHNHEASTHGSVSVWAHPHCTPPHHPPHFDVA